MIHKLCFVFYFKKSKNSLKHKLYYVKIVYIKVIFELFYINTAICSGFTSLF